MQRIRDFDRVMKLFVKIELESNKNPIQEAFVNTVMADLNVAREIRSCRVEGVSWKKIAELVGMSTQGVINWYRKREPYIG